jgi:hypothetical protein
MMMQNFFKDPKCEKDKSLFSLTRDFKKLNQSNTLDPLGGELISLENESEIKTANKEGFCGKMNWIKSEVVSFDDLKCKASNFKVEWPKIIDDSSKDNWSLSFGEKLINLKKED